MRGLLLIAILGCLSQDAIAAHPARGQALYDIEWAIQRATNTTKAIERKEIDWQNAGDLSKSIQIEAEIHELKGKREQAYNKAIWLTIKASGLLPLDKDGFPVVPEGTSVLSSPQKGNQITWLPVFRERGIVDIQNEKGKNIAKYDIPPEVLGNTASDGVSRLFPDAFANPALLASVIIHELVHIEQFTTPRTGRPLTPGEREMKAY